MKPTEHNEKRVAIYNRITNDSRVTQLDSLEDQKRELEQQIKNTNFIITHTPRGADKNDKCDRGL